MTRYVRHVRTRSMSLVGLAVVLAVLTACTSSRAGSGASAGDGTTLRIAFSETMGAPDPATFYSNEGLNVMHALYEGLLQYAPNTVAKPETEVPSIEPLLATEYKVSADGLKYTFKLRTGVKFHDGTVMDSTAVKKSFERFHDVQGGPSYMLADVRSYETPDANTFVVNMKQPVEPFITYLASPYGPKVMSPKAISENTQGDDLAQGWLKTHDAGTGAYQIEAFGTAEYKLAAFSDYWGDRPQFTSVVIKIIPDFTTQQLQLKQGNLDLLISGVLPRDLPTLEGAGMKTWVFDNPVLDVLWLNPDRGAFANADVRKALAGSLDRDMMVKSVLGNTGSVAKTMVPRAELPPGTATFTPASDREALKRAVANLKPADRAVTLAYASQDAINKQMSDLITNVLTEAGMKVTQRGTPKTQMFAWATTPQDRPDLALLQGIGDSANPYTWYGLFYTVDAPLNFMASKVNGCAAADAFAQQGLGAKSTDAAVDLYLKADAAYAACGTFLPIADTKGIMAYRSGLEGLEHPFASQTAVLLSKLRGSGSGS